MQLGFSESAALKTASTWSRPGLFLREVGGWAFASVIAGAFGGFFVFVLDRGLGWCAGLRGEIPVWIIWALPVIMLTARGSEEETVEGLEAGADDYVPKPFRQKELLARAERLLARARAEEGAVLERG